MLFDKFNKTNYCLFATADVYLHQPTSYLNYFKDARTTDRIIGNWQHCA